MKNIEQKLNRILNSLVGIALILVGLVLQNTYISIPLAIIGLVVCILASPILKTKEEKERDDDTEKPSEK